MLSIEEARPLVAEWNATHTDEAFVIWEHVEECLLAFLRWQCAVAGLLPAAETTEYLERHNRMCRRIPDELLLALFEADECLTG